MDNTKKNFIWNMIGTTINAFTSLIFMIIVTRINGTDIAGIFTFAFSLACLFQVISNYAGRTFQVTNNDKEFLDSDFMYNRLTTCLIMLFCIIGYLFIKDYTSFKNIIIILFIIYRLIESYVDVFYGIIQRNNSLYKVGISLTIKSLLCIFIFFIVDYFTKDVVWAIISLLIVSLVVFVFYDRKNYKEYYSSHKYKRINNLRLLKLGIFICGFNFLTQYILNAPKYAIDSFLDNQSQTIYGIISMPASFLVLCSQFAIQPYLTTFSKYIDDKDYKGLLKLSIRIIIGIFVVGIICIIGATLLGIPVLQMIYGVNLDGYLISLLIIIFGATFFGMSFIISSILVAMRKSFIQIVFYVVMSIFIMFISKYLVIKYSILGACLSYGITMLGLFVMYIIYFVNYLRRKSNG